MKKNTRLTGLCLALAFGAITSLNGQTQFITNGTFETGDFTGWTIANFGAGALVINDGTFLPTSGGGALPPISGSYDALTDQGGPSIQMASQPFIVPAVVTSAILSWNDRIMNYASVFSDPNQEFRVELVDILDNVITTVYSTNPGDPLQQIGPNARSFDLTSVMQTLGGQTVKVRFTEEDNLLYFNVYLDNVSFLVSTCAPLSMSFNLSGEKPQWKAAGASNDNTFYYGIAQDKNVKVKVTGGVGPFTYTWSNNQGYTTKPLGAPNASQLFEPQGPSYMVCTVLDIGTGCTSKDSVFVDWSNQFWCGVTGGTSADFWKLTICQSGVTSCVSWNAAKAAIFSSPPTATLGACPVPKTDFVNQSANLSVYPNPSNGLFTLEMPIASNTKGNVAVTDINGRVLYMQALVLNEGTLYHTIDLGALPNGIYMVRVATENEFATERIQIIR